jgi:hypothetical protein
MIQATVRNKSLLVVGLLWAGSLIGCNPLPAVSTGPADTRVAGTWRLLERRFLKDSVYSVKIDTITQTRDTSFLTVRRYPAVPAQTITFNSDGTLTASGSEMSYYFPMQAFRVDATYPDSLFMNFYITSNRATTFSRQPLRFHSDTMLLVPSNEAYSRFLRVR